MVERLTLLERSKEELTVTNEKLTSKQTSLETELDSKETMILALQAERDHMVGVLREQFRGQSDDVVKGRMETQPVQESDEVQIC